MGRALGCSTVLATQRPTSDTIDVGTRALIDLRFALKCADRFQAESILGSRFVDPHALVFATAGGVLWIAGWPNAAVRFFEITDGMVPGLL